MLQVHSSKVHLDAKCPGDFTVVFISPLDNQLLFSGAMGSFPVFYLMLFCVPVYVHGT